ncbi:MAG: hypothetical protein CL910_00430 [Deltaproteobacteria bacterium]|jgi:type IV pilus assembly protein PilP|nr:hypothetical protein [Deltaproteobacteria bacterium]
MSHRKLTAAALGSFLLLALGCQETGAPATPEQANARAQAAVPGGGGATAHVAAVPTVDTRSYVYDPIGKRDPFRSFVLDRVKDIDASAKGPLEQFDLSQLSITGVVWQAGNRRALVIDPSGQAYIVSEGDRIGKNNGQVITIGDSRMTVKERYEDFHGDMTTKEIVMRIRLSQGG